MILTDEEIAEVIDLGNVAEGNRYLPFAYARAIEVKVLEKLADKLFEVLAQDMSRDKAIATINEVVK